MSKVKKMVLNEKKETILVWLDFGPYSYINLGIIKELKELKEFDFIGIVTTHQDLSFFQKQKFISFKKLFYYPDCYIGKTDFNINKIKMIEESLDLDLWKDIFSESAKDTSGNKINFFDKGSKRNWTKELSHEMKDKIEKTFNKEMRELGYL